MTKQNWVGAGIMLLAVSAFFAYGWWFELWGHEIQFRWVYLGWLFCILLMPFGTGYMTGGLKNGIKSAASFGALLLAALLCGILLGNYR